MLRESRGFCVVVRKSSMVWRNVVNLVLLERKEIWGLVGGDVSKSFVCYKGFFLSVF